MRIVMAGASGLLGTALGDRFRADGHDVTRLVRRPAQADDESRLGSPTPAPIDQGVVESADVVVNTAGVSLLGNVHSKKWAREVRESRVRTTATLREAIAAAGGKASFLVSNGIAYYGDHGPEVVTEESASLGDAFLTGVTRAWQAATAPAAEAGARVCVLRTAPVAAEGQPAVPAPAATLPTLARHPARLGPAVRPVDLAPRLDRRGRAPGRSSDRGGGVQPVLPDHADQRRSSRERLPAPWTARRSSPCRRRSCGSRPGRWHPRC